MASVLNANAPAMISASGVLCETAVCRLEIALNRNLVFGPTIYTTTPDVLRCVRMHPAKSASA